MSKPTKKSIDLEAGRELDCLIAEKLEDYRWVRNLVQRSDSYDKPRTFPIGALFLVSADECTRKHYSHRLWGWPEEGDEKAIRFDYFVPHYSTSLQTAWTLTDKMGRKGWFKIAWRPNGWAANGTGMQTDTVYADTPALAICRAALQAKEIELISK